MAELKHTFVKGRMNKDLDERLIPNGEYRDALNIQISNSEGSDSGAIENVLGNVQISSLGLTNAECIGTVADPINKRVYWLVTSDNVDGIYEYDTKADSILPVIVDPKISLTTSIDGVTFRSNINDDLVIDNLSNNQFASIFNILEEKIPATNKDEVIVNNNVVISSTDPSISITVPKNSVMMKEEDGGFVFRNIKYTGQNLGDLSLKFVYSNSSVLGFSKSHLITGINILNGILFFTDNLNQPRAIDISKFKRYSEELIDEEGNISKDSQTKVLGDVYISEGVKESFERFYEEKDIVLAKKAPTAAPKMVLKNTLRDGEVSAVSEKNLYTDGVLVRPNNEDPTFNITYSVLPDWKVGDKILFTPSETTVGGETEFDEWEATAVIREILVASKKITFEILSYTEDPENKVYILEQDLIQEKPLYELKFPRFSYRWKYKDNTYSTFAPFTVPAFLPGEFDYDGKKSFNEGVVNTARRITLSDFKLGDDTVKEVDIIMKYDDDNNVYVISTEKKESFFGFLEITKEQIKSTIPNQQLLRQWDNIPKRAKSQEVVGNRLIYGNYVQNYNIYNTPEFDISLVNRPEDQIYSVKSDRNLELGVVYSDGYNRQTPVLAGKNSAFSVAKNRSISANQLKASLNNTPPAWATHFKYFIKDSSSEYYNLAADRFYEDQDNGFTYVSFPSADRNKITNENYLVLKKQHGANKPVVDDDNRYKVLDIFNEAPSFITDRTKQVVSAGDLLFTKEHGKLAGKLLRSKANAANSAPLKDFATIKIARVNDDTDAGVAPEIANEIKKGRFISFSYEGKTSEKYEVQSIRQHSSGKNEIEIKFVEPFGEDVEIIYNSGTQIDGADTIGDQGTTSDTDLKNGDDSGLSGIIFTVHEKYSAVGEKEFEGKFFVKLQTNSTLNSSISRTEIGDKDYLAKESIPLIGFYAKEEDGKRNNGRFDNTARGRANAHKSAKNKFIVSHGGKATNGASPEEGQQLQIGGLNYNISLECATHFMDGEVSEIVKKIKVGNFVRFVNSDGTPHHDKVYEIGNVLNQKFDKKYGSANTRNYRRFSLRFVQENPNVSGEKIKLELERDVISRGEGAWDSEPRMEILEERNNENTEVKDPAIFETEPLPSKTDLNIYFETDDSFPISKHGQAQYLNWYNCFSFGNGVESNRIRDDFNAPYIKNGVKASTILEEGYKEEKVFNGLIWSGVINPNSSVNNSNQFLQAEQITKTFLPSYGEIQKLHAWDDSLVVFTQNKVLRTPANKSSLYNADGSTNLISTNRVIGDPIEYNGAFGISDDPWSFASFGYRCYFVDRKNGKVLRLSKDGLTPISAVNMNDFFRDRLSTDQKIFGSFDERNKLYNVSFTTDNDTVCFSEGVNGWVTRKSFLPQNAISLNSNYYSFNNGELWQHDSENVDRNNFYGTEGKSTVKFEINEDPSAVKKYKTLSYEGSKDWTAVAVTDQEKSGNITFKNKENKYFSNLTGETKVFAPTSSNLDLKKFNFQGIGRPSSTDTIDDNRVNTSLRFSVDVEGINSIGSNDRIFTRLPGESLSGYWGVAELNLAAPAGYRLEASDFKQILGEGYTTNINSTFEQVGDGIKLKYTHGINFQPNEDVLINILISGKLIKNNVTLSGNHSVTLNGATSSIGANSYSLTGKSHVEKTILTRIITASDGFEIYPEDISVDNPAIRLIITEITRGQSYRVIEKTVMPGSNETGRDYTIKALAKSVQIPTKKLSFRAIQENNLGYNEETRFLDIHGDPGAVVNYKFKNTSSTIEEKTITIPSGGTYTVYLNFPAGTTAETFTVEFAAGSNTEFGEDWQGTATIKRLAKETKKITLIASLGSISQTYTVSADVGSQIRENVELTLNGGAFDYSLKRYPQNTDFIISDEDGDNTIKFSGGYISISGTPKNVIKLQVQMQIDNLAHNDVVLLDLAKFVSKEVDLTINYNTTTTGGTDTAAGSSYSFSPASYTITGASGLAPSIIQGTYRFTLTIASGSELIPGIGTGDFKIFDSSNNDVTSDYDDNNELRVAASGNTVYIDLKPKGFLMPSSDTTITIRPTKSIVQTPPAITPVNYRVKANSLTRVITENPTYVSQGLAGKWNIFSEKISAATTSTSGILLVQFKYSIDRESNADDGQRYSKWSNASNSVSFINSSDTELSLANSGTYTDINGDSQTITGSYEVEIAGSKSILTVNLLLNTANIPANKRVGEIEVSAGVSNKEDIANETTAGVSTKEEACLMESLTNFSYWNTDFSTDKPKAGAYVVSEGAPIVQGNIRLYHKDNDAGKIYHMELQTPTFRIIEILELCSYNTGYKDLNAAFYVSHQGSNKATLYSSVSDTSIENQNGNTRLKHNIIIHSNHFDSNNQTSVGFPDDIRVRFRLTFSQWDSSNSMRDFFNPEHAFKIENDQPNGIAIKDQNFVKMTNEYAEYDVTFDVTGITSFSNLYAIYVNPKSNDPYGGLEVGKGLFNLNIAVVSDFPASTNINRLSEGKYPGDLYSFVNLSYSKGA